MTDLAARQHCVFSLAQLNDLGLTASTIRKRAAAGRMHRIHRGVYSLVPSELLSVKGRYMAAVLAAGPGMLSHRSAADLLDLRRSDRRLIDVSVMGSRAASVPGLDPHCSTTLTAADTTEVDRIPCTTVARTLLDLAAVIPRRSLERAFDQAAILEVLDARAIEDQLARNLKHRGRGPLRAVLTEHRAGSTATWNDFEERLFVACRSAGLPDPEVNAWVVCDDGEPAMRVDFLWREQRVIVEADGYDSHRTRRAFETDRRRDQRLTLAGWEVIRITWRQLHDEPRRIAGMVAKLLATPR